jgi:quinolinate synthase
MEKEAGLKKVVDISREIRNLCKMKDAVILAHNYQVGEVQDVADHVGDSLELSRKAAELRCRIIVFAGVKFMAETAKILSPQKKVLLPRLDAGCPMADMITVEELLRLKAEHPAARVVTYVNSSVEIKAESDVCCTSANAVEVVRRQPSAKIIFVPDQNLGAYVQTQVPGKEIILFEGFCYVHHRIKSAELAEMKIRYPEAEVIVHPEVRLEVIRLADAVLSTSGMLKHVRQSARRQFIVATEQGLIERMQRENPGKQFFPAGLAKICSNMKRTGLVDVLASLQEEKYEIIVGEKVAAKALRALTEMIQYG